MAMSKRTRLLLITLMISLVMLVISFLLSDVGITGNVILISIFIVAFPQLVYTYTEYKDIKEMEERFPYFLRDLTESIRSGMPLHKAIIMAGKVDYGKLSKEVKKMAYQLTWGVSVIKVLEQAEKRLSSSPLISKNIRIVIETYKAGGNIDRTLDSIANAILTIQETENERKSTLNQYVTAMYAITYIFIGIIVGINRLLVPIFSSSAGLSGGPIGTIVGNPCEQCVYTPGIECSPCYMYFSICKLLGTASETIGCYYTGLFFSMIVVQSICGGLVAGQISEGSIKAGIKHSMILLASSSGIFMILVRLGLLGG
ncbi:MAG: type II secretion system F family protein [Candidatus Aenigmatarchaeota archaeon]|nr:type II secretion system F family protein [Candidatus Aenigmarchaeota archaeon]